MTDWLAVLESKHPVRRTEAQKQAFAAAFRATAEKLGWTVRTGTLDKRKRAQNLIVGDPATARVIVTAGYETPAWSLFPNVLMPRGWVLTAAYFLGQALLLLAAAFLLLVAVQKLFRPDPITAGPLLLLFYVGLMLLTGRVFANKRNRNASSGVAAVLAALEALPEAQRGCFAFILFDENTHAGAGAKAWGSAHADLAWSRLTLCLEAVGNGEALVCIRHKAANALPEYPLFEEAFAGDEAHPTFFYRRAAIVFPPRKLLPCAVQVLACRRSAGLGWHTPRLATARDTVAEPENITRLTEKLLRLADKLTTDKEGDPADGTAGVV